MGTKDHRIEYLISKADFGHFFGRMPKNRKEWDDFCHYCEKGLEAHIDWDMIYRCAKDTMEKS